VKAMAKNQNSSVKRIGDIEMIKTGNIFQSLLLQAGKNRMKLSQKKETGEAKGIGS
jgi:hypothetical protein